MVIRPTPEAADLRYAHFVLVKWPFETTTANTLNHSIIV